MLCLRDRNGGKGAAVQDGLKHATGDVVIIQDADLEYDPADYPVLLRPIQTGKAKVVYGSRFHRRAQGDVLLAHAWATIRSPCCAMCYSTPR